MHAKRKPSQWVKRFADLIPAAGQVLDLACGSGRHSRFLLEHGYDVLAVDRDVTGLGSLAGTTRLEILELDLEDSTMPTFLDRGFDGIVVTDYLYRPLLHPLCAALRPGGVLIYETFARGNEVYGRPSRADFLLEPGELLRVAQDDLHIVSFEQGLERSPGPAVRQRICAVRAHGVFEI